MADPQVADDDPEWRSDEEASRLRDETLARLLKMPPKPDERLGRGKTKADQDGDSAYTKRDMPAEMPHNDRVR